MNKQGGFAMSGMAILGICLVAIGLLTIGYGGRNMTKSTK